jgi:dnd system-associated protein 4
MVLQEIRINYEKEKLDFIDSLLINSESTSSSRGAFQKRINVIAFAAAYALKRGSDRLPVKNKATNSNCGADPIRFGVLEREDLATFFNFLAFVTKNDPNILENNNAAIKERAILFEEFANSGLSLLEEELKGEMDIGKALMLLVLDQVKDEEDDLGSILGEI